MQRDLGRKLVFTRVGFPREFGEVVIKKVWKGFAMMLDLGY